MAHSLQVDSFEYLQRLDVDRTLAPRTAGVDFDTLVRTHGRGLDPHTEGGQVVHREHTALRLDPVRDFLSDVALVEEVPGSLQRVLPALGGVVPFDFYEPPEGAGQVSLYQNVAGLQGLTVPVEYFGG